MSIARQFSHKPLIDTPTRKLGVTVTPVTRDDVTVTQRVDQLEKEIASLKADVFALKAAVASLLVSRSAQEQRAEKQSRAEYMREYRKRASK